MTKALQERHRGTDMEGIEHWEEMILGKRLEDLGSRARRMVFIEVGRDNPRQTPGRNPPTGGEERTTEGGELPLPIHRPAISLLSWSSIFEQAASEELEAFLGTLSDLQGKAAHANRPWVQMLRTRTSPQGIC
ncbi:MAG: hypothetical protein NTV33_09770 [Coprothermobacterota bacterium]|nr:hypothetical protein [Coprothermobacterota bacterium]